MPDVAILDGQLCLRLTVRERVLSLVDEDIAVRVSCIAKAVCVPDVLAELRGTGHGARIPGLMAIGTWTGHSGGRVYADLVVIERPGTGLVLTLTGQRWTRLLLGAGEPAQVLAELGRPGDDPR